MRLAGVGRSDAMGRKPNALILTYFERGVKLEDSSNRYQHTCKSCGEKFPKGRIDSLQNHLLKKCPALSAAEKQNALAQFFNLEQAAARNGAQMAAAPVDVPGGQSWTALETLAEVSRQVNLSESQIDRSQGNQSSGARSRTEESARIDRFELQEQWTPDNPPLSYDARAQREKKSAPYRNYGVQRLTNTAPSQKAAGRRESESTLPTASPSGNMSTSPGNITMATAASMAVAASSAFSMVDPQLLGEGMSEDMTQPTMNQQLAHRTSQGFTDWPMMDGSGASYPNPEQFENKFENNDEQNNNVFARALSMNHGLTTEFSAEYGNGQKPSKPKVRGRFTATRRKEVQEVRKQGACIRCRMLKKPCSGDSPCVTCRNVENARVWKQPCIRTRMADELDMYSAGLHAVLAYRQINAMKTQVKFQNSAKQIMVSHYPETTIYATFNALEGENLPTSMNIDPSLGLNDEIGDQTTVRILDNDNDDIPLKLDVYVKRISPVLYERQQSHFMKVTLGTAMEINIRQHDPLLSRVLELWSIVHILVDHELKWGVFDKTNMEMVGVQAAYAEDSPTYTLVVKQLNAAVEKKAASISKAVLSDLERRLLHRSSNKSFELFLVGIILLNCLEKSTWLYKSWEQVLKAEWPLDKTPVWYGAQGDSITDIVQMLLRMRNIPPKTYHSEDDGLVISDAGPAAKDFFDRLQLNCLSPTFIDSRWYVQN